jgi:hypothetical protein
MTNSRPPATLTSRVMRLMPGRRTSRTTGSTDPGLDPADIHVPGSSMAPPRSGGHMRDHYRTGAAAMLLVALIARSFSRRERSRGAAAK